jgi:hypothetical protein
LVGHGVDVEVIPSGVKPTQDQREAEGGVEKDKKQENLTARASRVPDQAIDKPTKSVVGMTMPSVPSHAVIGEARPGEYGPMYRVGTQPGPGLSPLQRHLIEPGYQD